MDNIETEMKSDVQKTYYGIRKMKYWTPDGREIIAVPTMRTYRMSKSGAEGIRDANLDKGWLMQPPIEKKPYCPHCTNWHDTQEEINACGAKKKAFQDRYNKIAKKVKRDGSEDVEELRAEVSGLKTDMDDIKKMLSRLLEKE